MAAPMTLSLTLNAKENADFAKFIMERVYQRDALRTNHVVQTGITMDEQIVFAGRIGKTGIKDPGTSRPNSGAKPTLTEKFWTPKKVGDTMIFNQSELNGLFKAYFDKITKYADIYDISGTDEEKFLMELFSESAIEAVDRLIWHGDTAIAVSGAAASGLINAADVKFYDSVDGLFKQIYAAVVAGSVKRFTITKNAAATFALQALAADEALTIFEGIWSKADPRLKSDANKVLMVTNSLFENYRQSLQTKGTPYDVTLTTNGFSELKWNGVTVRNMEILWDLPVLNDFEQLNTGLAWDKPHRAILTVPANLAVGTLNETDMQNLEAFPDPITRSQYLAYGFTLDAKLLEGYMTVAAY